METTSNTPTEITRRYASFLRAQGVAAAVRPAGYVFIGWINEQISAYAAELGEPRDYVNVSDGRGADAFDAWLEARYPLAVEEPQYERRWLVTYKPTPRGRPREMLGYGLTEAGMRA